MTTMTTDGIRFRQGSRIFYPALGEEMSMAGTDGQGRIMLMLPSEYREYMSGRRSFDMCSIYYL